MKDLTGISLAMFLVLLRIIPKVKEARLADIRHEDRLLLFLMKLKHELTFSSLGVLFSCHRTTASRAFYKVLDTIYGGTINWIQWFSRATVQETMPASFRDKYPNCRVIIDCTEVPVERPTQVAHQVACWSNYKHDFTAKFLVGIAPSGYITFVSKCYGGRSSDTYVTSNCGLLQLLEPNDLVMADKGFPHIQSDLDKISISLVMPPFARAGEQFTPAEVENTY